MSQKVPVSMTLIEGDCIKVLPTLPSKSVHLVIAGVSAFGAETMKRYNPGLDYDGYLKQIETLAECLRDVLQDGRMCIIEATDYNYDKSEDDVLMTADFLVAFRRKGFLVREDIVWDYGRTFERRLGTFYQYPNPMRAKFIRTHHHLYILQKGNFAHPKEIPEGNALDVALLKEQGFLSDIWRVPEEKRDDGLGVFPFSMAAMLVKLFSFKGETVLDPFLGRGTTMKACLEVGRGCVGIEIRPDRMEMIKDYVGWGVQRIGAEPVEWSVQ